jgi:hypothetical protein
MRNERDECTARAGRTVRRSARGPGYVQRRTSGAARRVVDSHPSPGGSTEKAGDNGRARFQFTQDEATAKGSPFRTPRRNGRHSGRGTVGRFVTARRSGARRLAGGDRRLLTASHGRGHHPVLAHADIIPALRVHIGRQEEQSRDSGRGRLEDPCADWPARRSHRGAVAFVAVRSLSRVSGATLVHHLVSLRRTRRRLLILTGPDRGASKM